MPKLTKGVVSREQALKLSSKYVTGLEQHQFDDALLEPFYWNWEKKDRHGNPTCGLKLSQKVLTAWRDCETVVYVLAVICYVQNPQHESDGPVVRVSNGEYSWRVDGDVFAVAIKD